MEHTNFLTEAQLFAICRTLEQKQRQAIAGQARNDNDIWRKRVMGAIGGALQAING